MQTTYTAQYDGNKFWFDVERSDGLPYQDDLFKCLDLFEGDPKYWIEHKTNRQKKWRSASVSAKSVCPLLATIKEFITDGNHARIISDRFVIVFYQ